MMDIIKKLAEKHIHLRLDNPKEKLPTDMHIGWYRWKAYVYANLFEEDNDTISEEEKKALLELGASLKSYHLVCWTRNRLIPLDIEKIEDLKKHIDERVRDTKSFFELRVLIYLRSLIQEEFYYIDKKMIKNMPSLLIFTHEDGIDATT